MQLKTKVFVLEVNNLSDARYCAGFGVDTIAFSTDGDKKLSLEEQVQNVRLGYVSF